MSFLYKRLVKLGEIEVKKAEDEKYDFLSFLLKDLKHVRIIPSLHWKSNERFTEVYNKDK